MKHDYYGLMKLYNILESFRNMDCLIADKKSENDGASRGSETEFQESYKITLWKKNRKVFLRSALTLFLFLWWRRNSKRKQQKLIVPHTIKNWNAAVVTPLSLLLVAAKKGLVTKALINNNSIAYQIRDERLKYEQLPWRKSLLPKNNSSLLNEIMNDLAEGGCLDVSVLPESLLSKSGQIFATAFPFLYLLLLYHMLKRLQKGHNDSDNAGVDCQNKDFKRITFADVAGVDTAQTELQEVVSYLSNPEPFHGLGATPPRGLLLHGKPGLGKTLLARAVAGEARADCFMSCTGSDFVEIFVGQGAKRVRQLFSDLRVQALKNWRAQNSGHGLIQYYFNNLFREMKLSSKEKMTLTRRPTAVLFIDEIDSLAKCRDGIGRNALYGAGGGNDEREQTLNALLAEMDGFNKSEVVVIVIAATNRLSILDPALIRPGRFDRHIALVPPDAEGREAILNVHARHKKFDTDINLHEIAEDRWTENFTGAELRNVLNEAALLAVREGNKSIRQKHIHQSIQRIKNMKF